MKRLLLFPVLLVFYSSGVCQKPEPFNYEAVIHDPKGEVVTTKPVSLKFTILKGSISGKDIYSEKQSVTTNQDGLISLSIGTGMEKTGDIDTINWNTDIYFLKVEIDPAGGNSYTEMSITQLLNEPKEPQKSTSKKSTLPPDEDEIIVTRKYVGNYLDYRHTGPGSYSGPNVIWIKTNMDNTFGKISAYGKTCDFTVGESLYIRKIYFSPGGVSGYWIYQIENNSSVYYRLSEFQYDKKVMTETWF